MNVRDLSFKIGDEVFRPSEICEVHVDGFWFELKRIVRSEGYAYHYVTVRCESSEVEVLLDGDDGEKYNEET